MADDHASAGALIDRLEGLRELVAATLRTHGQADYDAQTGTFDCRCGDWSGNFLSYHQTDKLLAMFAAALSDEHPR